MKAGLRGLKCRRGALNILKPLSNCHGKMTQSMNILSRIAQIGQSLNPQSLESVAIELELELVVSLLHGIH